MNLEILRPLSLLLLLLMPLIWSCHARSLSPLRGKRRALALGMRLLVLTLLVFALSEPRWRGHTNDAEVFLIVDQSRSVDPVALEAARQFADAADFAGAKVAWIGFAECARIFPTLEKLREADREMLHPNETRLDTALALAAASYEPGRVKTAVVFSDGVSTGGTLDPASLRAQGIRVQVVPVPPPDRPEVLVRDVRAPSIVRSNEPLAIDATLQSTRAGPAEVDLFRNGIRVHTQTIERKIGANEVRFEDRAGEEKLLHYEVRVRAAEDTIFENNLAGVAVISEGKSRVLLLTDQPESARYLERALRQEGVELSVRPPEGTPTQLSDLQNYDALILDNVPASGMSREQMELIRSYVSDFGGGLLMLGGDQAYGLGGYFRTPVEEVLPVSCDFQKEEESPALALALVIDRSGSMAGENLELAKAAAKASAELLGPRDYVSVLAFDHETHVIVPLQPAGDSERVTQPIASLTPGGGTNLAPAMEEALRQLRGNPAKLKHVILLTDGMSAEGKYYELTRQMVQNQITTSTVAMGSGADRNLLSQIAQWGNGRYYAVTDPRIVPQIFTKETLTASKSAIQEYPFLAKPVRAVDFLEGVNWSESPFLLGYVRTKPKPSSETWLVTERGDPLLTTWRFGLGMTAAFTSDARNRWAVEWLPWPGYGKFWGQLLRHLSRPTALGEAEVTVAERDGNVQVTLDALDSAQGFPRNADGEIRVTGPDGTRQTVILDKRLPGRWQASFSARDGGIYSGQIQLKNSSEILESRFFTFTKGFSPEFRLDPVNENALEKLAQATGGQLAPDAATIFHQNDRTALREFELWSWLALLALLGFVADVGIRRWPQSAQR